MLPAGPAALLAAGLLAQLLGRALGQAPPRQNCVSNCLEEALANVPTKGCAAGTFWMPYPRTAPVDACRPCLPGFYCPGIPYGAFPDKPVNLNRPIACPVGTFLDVAGASQVDECQNCTVGRYQDRPGKSTCFNCPAGKYVNTNGTSSVSGCLECPCGHYCLEGSVVPMSCPAGTWSPSQGNRVRENCIACPAGSACPKSTCNPFGCASCPPGKFSTGAVAGEGVGGGTDICALLGDYCDICPASFFCPRASTLPVSCPPGTTSQPGAASEADCDDCPVGYRCQSPANSSHLQSSVYREANGELVVGSVLPELCDVDTNVAHFSYPDQAGCIERCPYQLPRQSFCHEAGDGRLPDRGRRALRIGELLVQRSKESLFSQAQHDAAFGNISLVLENLTEEERMGAVTMPDHNGRTPLILAAMMGDTPLLELLWQNNASAGQEASVMRDVEGFTALMHSLRLGNSNATSWLIGHAKATLAPSDVEVLQRMGVDVGGVPVAAPEPADKHLGRGGLGWLHPSGKGFADWPERGLGNETPR